MRFTRMPIFFYRQETCRKISLVKCYYSDKLSSSQERNSTDFVLLDRIVLFYRNMKSR